MIVWEMRGKIIRTVPCCVVYNSCAQWHAHTFAHTRAVLKIGNWLRLRLHFGLLLVCFFWPPARFAFVVLGLVSSALSQITGWEERLQQELYCVEWEAKPYLNQIEFCEQQPCDTQNPSKWVNISTKLPTCLHQPDSTPVSLSLMCLFLLLPHLLTLSTHHSHHPWLSPFHSRLKNYFFHKSFPP